MELVSEAPWATVWREGDRRLKRCRASQLHEVPLTAALASRRPDRVPGLVDHGDDRLLLADAGVPDRRVETLVARDELDAALAVGAFTRILGRRRLGEPEPLEKHLGWFPANVVS
jgi:hypothetical protein